MIFSFIFNKVNQMSETLKNYRHEQSKIITIFTIVAVSNLIGVYTVTTLSSQFIFTFSYSWPIIIMTITIGFIVHKNYYLQNFLPSGIPINIAPILIPIETISVLSRVISLSVRLTANIISGHTLTHMIATFNHLVSISTVTSPIKFNCIIIDISIIISLAVYSLLTILYILEFGICILQAYVFILLTISYIEGSLLLH